MGSGGTTPSFAITSLISGLDYSSFYSLFFLVLLCYCNGKTRLICIHLLFGILWNLPTAFLYLY